MVAKDDIDELFLSSDSDSEETNVKEKKRQHKNLLKDIDALSGNTTKRTKKSTRSEPSKEVSEFTWSTGKDDNDKLELNDLVSSIDTTNKSIANTKKKLRKIVKSSKTLEKPLHKPEQERIERKVAYEETSKDISKWENIVHKNREAEQLTFPLYQYRPPQASTKTIVTNFKPQNDLEREINEVLHGSKHVLERKDKELTEAEEQALKKFDLQEAIERRKELQHVRALQSYYEAKCRRMKKIKSKKYHRILKKEKQKAAEKVDLDILAKEQPELYQRELDKAEKLRALERASLRHRNTSKWAKNLITKGTKNNKEDQERIREQLRISRQLTEHKTVSDSENEDDEDKQKDDDEDSIKLMTAGDDTNNPWLLGKKQKDNIEESDQLELSKKIVKPKAIVTKESKQRAAEVEREKEEENEERISSGDEWDDDTEIPAQTVDKLKALKKMTKKKEATKDSKRKKGEKSATMNDANTNVKKTSKSKSQSSSSKEPQFENVISKIAASKKTNECVSKTQDAVDTEQKEEETSQGSKSINNKTTKSKQYQQQEADTLRFLKSTDDENTIQLKMTYSNSDDEGADSDTEHMMNIRDAFANDDVIEEFLHEKSDVVEKSKVKVTDAVLPGWGSWAGAGIVEKKTKKRKNNRKQVAEEPAPKRKDDGKVNVIISEEKNVHLAKHQVAQVPFPFKNKTDFERSIRQPIGSHWNTHSAYQKLIQPRIEKAAGEIIEPLRASKKLKKKFKKDSQLAAVKS